MAHDVIFDFEPGLEAAFTGHDAPRGFQAADGGMGGAGGMGEAVPKPRNYRQTVCTYWLRGLCMKGDTCGFLHQFDPERMPVCRNLLKFGACKEPDCPYKHSLEAIKECNMYKLGFCIYGPACRFKHTRLQGPPPDPESLEACKPREHRNLNIVANQANENIMPERPRGGRGRGGDYLALPGGGGGGQYAMQQYGGGQAGRPPPPAAPYPGGQQAPGYVDPAVLAAVGQADLRFGF